MVAAKHVGIDIYATGPLDRAELPLRSDGVEDLAVGANGCEHAAGLHWPGQVDLVHRAGGDVDVVADPLELQAVSIGGHRVPRGHVAARSWPLAARCEGQA